jgi:hypothetical protein
MNKFPPPGESGPEAATFQGRRDESPSSEVLVLRQGHLPQRSTQEISLTPQAHEWLAKLPPRYQPMVTARRHPHIVNRLTALWHLHGPLCAYFHELLLTTRKGRTGFSLGVLTELTDLQTLLREMAQGGTWAAAAHGATALAPSNSLRLVYQAKPNNPSTCERNPDPRR